eukprot:CAMPEP_0168412280 /NCGR_PEP_ID=MMETSP0228-20121227/28628_1 /TAXON_ID=133427 /ORGANISM="Protoceratium reticulatum, Strain CCCM 535 (=CCMP 1889)" /LENGTH=33 /DNA_ID= /DNA_START= /DNA_END= /DNA_ORIENTATION=
MSCSPSTHQQRQRPCREAHARSWWAKVPSYVDV